MAFLSTWKVLRPNIRFCVNVKTLHSSKTDNRRRSVQDGRVRLLWESLLIFSCESPKITTRCDPAGRCWNIPKKDAPCSKTMKSFSEMAWGVHGKVYPIPPGWATHRLQNNIPKKSSHYHEGLSPTAALGSSKGTRNPQGIWLGRPVGFSCRTSMKLEKTDTPLLEGTNNT